MQFQVFREVTFLWESDIYSYGDSFEATSFEDAVNKLKENNSSDIFGTSLIDHISKEDVSNQIFQWTNPRGRYSGDIFFLEEITQSKV